MEHNVTLSKDDISCLQQFHRAHFPGQEVPSLKSITANTHVTTESKHNEGEDDLGYYEDGVKRTLTDDQIAMFRNSEIQRIMQERRKATEREEYRRDQQKRQQNDVATRKDGQQSWTRHFDEAPQSIDTLVYDDTEQEASTQSEAGSKKFLWPKLGQ